MELSQEPVASCSQHCTSEDHRDQTTGTRQAYAPLVSFPSLKITVVFLISSLYLLLRIIPLLHKTIQTSLLPQKQVTFGISSHATAPKEGPHVGYQPNMVTKPMHSIPSHPRLIPLGHSQREGAVGYRDGSISHLHTKAPGAILCLWNVLMTVWFLLVT